MLYSASRNFAFIHIPKAAGTSVVNFLRNKLPDLECIGKHHNGVGDLHGLELEEKCPCGLIDHSRKKVPDITLGETRFLAVLRDPVDIWISHYHWGVKRLGIYRESSMPDVLNLYYALLGKARKAYRNAGAFLAEGSDAGPEHNNYYRDHLGRPLLDRLSLHGEFPQHLYLIRYEELNTSLPAFMKNVLQVQIA